MSVCPAIALPSNGQIVNILLYLILLLITFDVCVTLHILALCFIRMLILNMWLHSRADMERSVG